MASVIKILKLISGDEIIGVVQDGRDVPSSDDAFTNENLLFVSLPMKITTTYDQTLRAHSIFLSDWVPSIADETFVIEKQQIITVGNPNPDIEEHYFELTAAHSLLESEQDIQSKLKKILKNHKFDDDDMT